MGLLDDSVSAVPYEAKRNADDFRHGGPCLVRAALEQRTEMTQDIWEVG